MIYIPAMPSVSSRKSDIVTIEINLPRRSTGRFWTFTEKENPVGINGCRTLDTLLSIDRKQTSFPPGHQHLSQKIQINDRIVDVKSQKTKSRRISLPNRDHRNTKQEEHVQFDLLLPYNIAATLTVSLSPCLTEISSKHPNI
jgi:hypothetical protein